MPATFTEACSDDLKTASQGLDLAVPPAGEGLDQDEEWVVVRQDGEWQQIRLHDYDDLFAIPGLYERWVYDLLACQSPQTIRDLLRTALQEAGESPASLSVLDLGAGNGYVAGVLGEIGVERFVGIDINPNAAIAAERDRPGLYADYVVDDLTNPTPENASILDATEFNCLTCVAALGFGDIPPEVFKAAYDRIAEGGWVAFTIKSNFLSSVDRSGFADLIHEMIEAGTLEVASRVSYPHRKSTDGHDLIYEAFVGRKRSNS